MGKPTKEETTFGTKRWRLYHRDECIILFFYWFYLLLVKGERAWRRSRSGLRRRGGRGGRRERGAARWGGGTSRKWPWLGTWRWEWRWRRSRRRRRWRSCQSWSNARLCGRWVEPQLVATRSHWRGPPPPFLVPMKILFSSAPMLF